MFGHMHEVLNAVEKITNYTVNARDEIGNGNFQFENRFRDFIDWLSKNENNYRENENENGKII